MALLRTTAVSVMLVPFVDGPPILSHVGAVVNVRVPGTTVPPLRHRLCTDPEYENAPLLIELSTDAFAVSMNAGTLSASRSREVVAAMYW
jgi:hypothetical protein